MYIIKRTDCESLPPRIMHAELSDAIEEAKRLAVKHAKEDGTFQVYEMILVKTITGMIVITEYGVK